MQPAAAVLAASERRGPLPFKSTLCGRVRGRRVRLASHQGRALHPGAPAKKLAPRRRRRGGDSCKMTISMGTSTWCDPSSSSGQQRKAGRTLHLPGTGVRPAAANFVVAGTAIPGFSQGIPVPLSQGVTNLWGGAAPRGAVAGLQCGVAPYPTCAGLVGGWQWGLRHN
jgi:hypothetical protein